MPFKSKAQRRKFAQLLVEGEISPEVFEEWNRETGAAKLPERVRKKRPKKPAARGRGRRSSRRPTTKKTASRRTAKKRATTRV